MSFIMPKKFQLIYFIYMPIKRYYFDVEVRVLSQTSITFIIVIVLYQSKHTVEDSNKLSNIGEKIMEIYVSNYFMPFVTMICGFIEVMVSNKSKHGKIAYYGTIRR